MRIQPVINIYNALGNQNSRTIFESKAADLKLNRQHHRYTGVASVDLAYASMFDKNIAEDLKFMKLI